MKIQSLSIYNRSENQNNTPNFKANIYAVFDGASNPNWNNKNLHKLPITFLKNALKTGLIKIENAAIAKLRSFRTGKIINNGVELPQKVEFLLMDTTTPEYKKFPPMLDKKASDNFFNYVKAQPSTKKIPISIDLEEQYSTESIKDLNEFLNDLPKIIGIEKDNIDLSHTSDIIDETKRLIEKRSMLMN